MGYLKRRDIAFAEADPKRDIPISPNGPNLNGAHRPHLALTPIRGNLNPSDDEYIVSVGLSRVWFVQYSRNAWHATWITRYFNRGSVCLSKTIAKENAETHRAQGSVFSIYELPSLALQTTHRTLLMVEINQEDATAKLTGLLKTWRLPLHWFINSDRWPRDIGWFASLRPVVLPLVPRKEPYKAFKAESLGGAYRLAWRPIEPSPVLSDSMARCVLAARRFTGCDL
jgi:hypothetical protein